MERTTRLALALLATLGLASPLYADHVGAAGRPQWNEDGLDGRGIYELVVANRLRAFSSESRLISADRVGRTQESRFRMHWKDFRGENGSAPDAAAANIVSKTLVKYTHPFDLRHAGYLVQTNRGRANDQFVYYPSRRRVARVNLRGEAVYGTDFSFEDVIPREAEDFSYRRLPDGELEGMPVFVVELFPEQIADSEYSKIRVFVDRERHVVLRARYWDEAEVEIKRFTAVPSAIRQFDGVWIPMEAIMRHLLLESTTRLEVIELEANPELAADTFDLGHLESH